MQTSYSDPTFQYGLRQIAITKLIDGELIGSNQDFYENIEAVYICVDKKYDKILEVLFAFCKKNVLHLRKNNLIPKEVDESLKIKARKRTCKSLGLSVSNGSEKYKSEYIKNLYIYVYWDFIQRHTLEQVKQMFDNIKN